MSTTSDNTIWATAMRERWRQCGQCTGNWEEDPVQVTARCPMCGALTTLNPYSPSGLGSTHQVQGAPGSPPVFSMDMYVSLEGRISRSNWWLWYYLPAMAVGLLGLMTTIPLGDNAIFAIIAGYAIAVWIYVVGTIKRWHDHDKSGWWIFVSFIPLIGGFWNLAVCGFQQGTVGPNSFGPDPVARYAAS